MSTYPTFSPYWLSSGIALAERTRQLETVSTTRAALCFEVPEAARILRMSGAQFYNRIHDDKLGPQSV
jgi:hypothetical protein